jgi:ribosome-binding protein aMBF1 (putative translation factor)
MSMHRSMSPTPVIFPDTRQTWRQMFGIMIQDVREFTARSLEEAAQLAGMEPSVWAAVEDGEIVVDPAWLRPMADSLGIRFDQLAPLVCICQGAWQD